MAATDKKTNVNTSAQPRAEPDSVRSAEHEAIETAMETGKQRRIRKREQEAQSDSGSTESTELSEHHAREHSIRAEDIHDGKADDIRETRTKARSGRRQRQEKAGKDRAGSKLMEGEGSPKESKLIYVDEDDVIPGSGMAGSRMRRLAAASANEAMHRKVSDQEDENVGVEASHRAELLSEDALRRTSARASDKLRQRSSAEVIEREKARAGENLKESIKRETASAARQEAESKSRLKKLIQKQRYKRQYAAAKYAELKGEQVIVQNARFTVRVKAALKEAFTRKGRLALIIGILLLIMLLMMAAVSSCTASIHGMTSSFIATTYPSTDEDIHKVENAYEDMEARLNAQISRMEGSHPEYDEYRFQVDEISHNPYHLISYFTTKYGEFTYDQVKDELKEIFQEQYSLSTKSETGTVTETKKVRVGESLGTVTTSGYCSCSICCGIWAGGPTASGKYPKANHTIAVDANHPFVPMGTHVIMNGTEYVVEDTGAFARFGVDFDVYYSSHSAASAHGHKKWEAYLADSNGKKEIEVTSTHQVNRLNVTMTNHDLDEVLRARMTKDEEAQYEILNKTYGNRDYLFDLDSLPTYGARGGGSNYKVPPEALSDKRFARMLREAEKYLGYPYVWGGSSPSTSFDCSGYVSWVINHCGNGWSYGRLGAEGLRQICVKVSPSAAKPGDLIFFQKTYPCGPGASHVGIYVGNGMMIHCGNPIQYTSVKTSYWQQHFLSYGRLP